MVVLKRLIKLMLPYWKPMIGGVILAFLTIGSNMGLLITAAYLLSWSALQPPVLHLMTLVAGVRFFGLSRGAFRYGERYVTHRAALSILGEIRSWIYNSLEALSPGQLLSYHSGQLLSRLVSDVEVLKEVYLRVLLPPLTALLVFVATTIFLGSFHWSLAIAFAIFYALAAIGIPWAIKHLVRGKEQLGLAREELNTILVDSLKGLTEIATYGMADDQKQKAAGKGSSFALLQGEVQVRNALAGSLSQLIGHLAMFSVLCISIILVTAGHLQGVWIAALALGVLASFEAIHGLTQVIPNLEDTLAAGERVLELVDMPSLVTRPLDDTDTVLKDYSVLVKGLSFSYPGSSELILRDINFQVGPGGRMAVVGPSGAGKSTMAQLLLGFWNYNQGSILIAGKELNSYSEASLWSTVALVSRQTYLFNATIKENLLLAKPDASHEELMDAANKTQLLSHIKDFPDGFNTMVGEGGWKLSGGQRQLLALTRTFLQNPPVLVLDEATEGLDPITENQVLAAIQSLMADRTTIMITHRLTGLEAMNEILVLDQGRILERGTHQELINSGARYHYLYQLQQTI